MCRPRAVCCVLSLAVVLGPAAAGRPGTGEAVKGRASLAPEAALAEAAPPSAAAASGAAWTGAPASVAVLEVASGVESSGPDGAATVLLKMHLDSPTDKQIGVVQGMTVIASLLFFVGIVQMLQYPDPQVRSYSYKTVFTCISIFEALSFVTIQNEVILGELVDPYVGGERSVLRRCISFLIFLGWFTSMSTFSWRVRHYPCKLFAAGGILSHVCAFTLVESAAKWQMEGAKSLFPKHGMTSVYTLYVACPVATALAFVALRLIARRLRHTLVPAPPSILASSGSAGVLPVAKRPGEGLLRKSLAAHWMRAAGVLAHDEGESHRKWLQEADENENQTSASVVGFLICRLCYCVSAGRVPPVDCEKDPEYGCAASSGTVWLMCSCTLLLYLSTVAVSFGRERVKSALDASNAAEDASADSVPAAAASIGAPPVPGAPAAEPALLAVLEQTAAPAASGSTLRPSLAKGSPSANGDGGAELSLEVLGNVQLSLLMAMSWCILVIVRWMLDQGIPGGATGHRVVNAFVMSPLCVAVIIVMDKLADWHKVSSETAEACMKTFALCVGLEWEKAVAASMTAAIDVSTIGRQHPALCQLGVCVMLAAALLPVWMWFIVPRARLPVPPRDQPPSESET